MMLQLVSLALMPEAKGNSHQWQSPVKKLSIYPHGSADFFQCCPYITSNRSMEETAQGCIRSCLKFHKLRSFLNALDTIRRIVLFFLFKASLSFLPLPCQDLQTAHIHGEKSKTDMQWILHVFSKCTGWSKWCSYMPSSTQLHCSQSSWLERCCKFMRLNLIKRKHVEGLFWDWSKVILGNSVDLTEVEEDTFWERAYTQKERNMWAKGMHHKVRTSNRRTLLKSVPRLLCFLPTWPDLRTQRHAPCTLPLADLSTPTACHMPRQPNLAAFEVSCRRVLLHVNFNMRAEPELKLLGGFYGMWTTVSFFLSFPSAVPHASRFFPSNEECQSRADESVNA